MRTHSIAATVTQQSCFPKVTRPSSTHLITNCQESLFNLSANSCGYLSRCASELPSLKQLVNQYSIQSAIQGHAD